jgi:hypothetical protein
MLPKVHFSLRSRRNSPAFNPTTKPADLISVRSFRIDRARCPHFRKSGGSWRPAIRVGLAIASCTRAGRTTSAAGTPLSSPTMTNRAGSTRRRLRRLSWTWRLPSASLNFRELGGDILGLEKALIHPSVPKTQSSHPPQTLDSFRPRMGSFTVPKRGDS